MYSASPSAVGSATINPAALNSPDQTEQSPRGIKRSRSPSTHDPSTAGDDGADSRPDRKRLRPMKSRSSGSVSETPGQPPAPALAQAISSSQTPQPHSEPLPAAQTTPAYRGGQAHAPPKSTPTKSTLKALPTVRDHTTDQLNPAGDEYMPREVDEFGEKKVMANGQLLGNRTYRCRTFLVPNRGDKLFMLATECARVLGYRDSYLLFNKNRSLYKIIASQTEKDDLVHQEILPFSYRSRQIAIVTARSMFRQFGSRVIENGRRVRDDYWETKARKQGFTEADLAGEKRPGAAKAREAAEAQNQALMNNPHTEIVYSTPAPGPYQQQLMQPDLGDTTRPRDYSSIVKGGPRQEITGPPYQDQTRSSPLVEIHSQAHHAADFNRSVNQQRDMRNDYLQNLWRRPHEQPPSSSMTQPVGSGDSGAAAPATSRPASSHHTSASGITQPSVASQSPQMMMTTAAPYTSSLHAQTTPSQAPHRGSVGSIGPGGAPNYNYQQASQPMWGQSPQTPQQSYGSYTTQGQPPHPSQSPAAHLRQPSTGPMQPLFPSMGGMPYGTSQSMYPADQTPRQYMPQPGPGPSQVSQPWSGQHSSPQQWWTQQPQ